MRGIIANAQIFADEGKPAQGLGVSVEVFLLEAQGWEQVDETKTDQEGRASFKIDGGLFDNARSAPTLRLTEQGDPQPRVLSMGGAMRFDGRRQILEVDFGRIDRLEETAFALPRASARLNSIPHVVAGVALQEGRSEVALNRNLRLIPGANDSIATTTRTGNDVIIGDIRRGTIVTNTDDRIISADASDRLTAGADNIVAVASTKQIDALRAITLEQNQRIVLKDQELATSKAQLLTTSTRLTAAEASLVAEKKRADDAAAKVAELEKAAGIDADVADVVTGLGTKLSIANTTLSTQAHPFRIGTVRVDLKGTPSADGGRIVLGGAAETTGSGLSTELHVDRPTTATDDVTVPDVTGLTESAARRVVRSVGLRLAPAYQVVKPGQGTPGQSISQVPAAQATAKHGAEVLVVFGTAPAE
ncbi:MAG: PASTA domain-containing protein [Pseudomonadota bacterium]